MANITSYNIGGASYAYDMEAKNPKSWKNTKLTLEGNLVYDKDGEVVEPQVVEKVETPVATPAAGAVSSGTEVELSTATDGADIYYTTDGTTPTAEDTKYTAKIAISAETTIKAIAVKEGMTDSDVLTAAYTISE